MASALVGLGGFVGLRATRAGSPGRLVVRAVLLLATVVAGLVGLSAVGLSALLVLRMAQGGEVGFGGVFAFVGPFVGMAFLAGAVFLFQLSRWKGR